MDLCGVSPGTVSPLIPLKVLWTRGVFVLATGGIGCRARKLLRALLETKAVRPAFFWSLSWSVEARGVPIRSIDLVKARAKKLVPGSQEGPLYGSGPRLGPTRLIVSA